MQENTNQAIAYNSIIIYGKLIINTICVLFSTRFALQALGVVDFGLYAVLGGVISLIGIFNTIMLSTSNRFIAVAIGRGNIEEINTQFNVNLVVHVAIALIALIIAFPIGEWYIPRFVNYDGALSNAMMVFYVSILGSILSFVGVPYNGLLMAKEKFLVFSFVEVLSQVLKLIVAWVLVYEFEQKLLIYTITMSILTAGPTLVYILYCRKYYFPMVRLKWVSDKTKYSQVFGFSAWISIGAVAHVGKNQGAALIINTFFNTVMNSAMGVANSINSYIGLFAQGLTQPMQPQIVKSYASGDFERTDELLIMSTKYSFMLTLLIGSVFLAAPEWLLGLWLGTVPPYSSIFLILFIIDSLVGSLNAGVGNVIFANGRISLYQSLVTILNIFAIILGFLVLKAGAPAYYLLVAYIFVSVCKFFAIQFSLKKTLNYNTRKLWEKSYIPSMITAILFVPVLFFPDVVHPAIKIGISLVYLSCLEWFVCLSKKEKSFIRNYFKI